MVQKHVDLVDLIKSFRTNIYYLLATIGVDTAENEPSEILKFGCRPRTDSVPCAGFLTNEEIPSFIEFLRSPA